MPSAFATSARDWPDWSFVASSDTVSPRYCAAASSLPPSGPKPRWAEAVVAEAAEPTRAEEEARSEGVARLDPLAQGVRLLLGEPAVLHGCVETLEGGRLVRVLELLLRHAELLRDRCVEGVALGLRVEDAGRLRYGRSCSDCNGRDRALPTISVRFVRCLVISMVCIEASFAERFLKSP